MSFGPESKNPRERRAYAHAVIGRLGNGEVNYGEALQTAYMASGTLRGGTSGFEGALKNAADKVKQTEQGASGHRKLRRVPLDWQHPRDEEGRYVPLFDTREAGGGYTIGELEWMIKEDGSVNPDEDISSWFMPTFKDVPAEEMGICLYETTSEGTPVTPVFPDTVQGHKDFAAYAAEYATVFGSYQASVEEWAQRFFGQPE